MMKAYREHAAERAALGIPPLALDAKQTAEVAAVFAEDLKKTLLVFDFFNDLAEKAKASNAKTKEVMCVIPIKPS